MIINKVRLQEEHPMTSEGGSWPLPYCNLNLDPTSGENGYILKAAQGLGPPELISVVDGFDEFGTPIMDSAPEKRDIVLRIGLNPRLSQTFGELRDEIYKYISRTVLVSLMNESLILAQTTGFIRTFEVVHFSNQPEIQITIECYDGVFYAPDRVDIPLDTLETTTPVITYGEGTAPTGLELQFTHTGVGTETGFTISNHARFWYVGAEDVFNQFQINFDFEPDDVITISTQTRNKRVTLLRDAVLYDLAGYINPGAVWPKLYSGVNTFEWTYDADWMTWTAANYIPRWWGV